MLEGEKRQMRQHSFHKEYEPISEDTYRELIAALEEEVGAENVHRTVEVQSNSVVKTIDNERDAQATLDKIRGEA